MSIRPDSLAAFTAAGAHHLPALQSLIFDHGANIWNYLPQVGIREHLQDIAQGRAHGVLALEREQLIGAVTFGLSTDFDRYLPEQARGTPQGYVSEAVVRAMAQGAVTHSHADVSIAVTGVAGPNGGSADKPVGTVWFGWSVGGQVASEVRQFAGDRAAVRAATVEHALRLLLRDLA